LRHKLILPIVFCAVLLSFGSEAEAVTYLSASNGDWNTASTWSPNGVPGASDAAYLYHSLVDANSALTVAELTLEASGALTVSGSLTVDDQLTSNGSVQISYGNFFFNPPNSFFPGPKDLAINGTLTFVYSGASTGGVVLQDQGVSLGNSLALNGGDNFANSVTGTGSLSLLQGSGSNLLTSSLVTCSSVGLAAGTTLALTGTTGTVFSPQSLNANAASLVEFAPGTGNLVGLSQGANSYFGGVKVASGVLQAESDLTITGDVTQYSGTQGEFDLNGHYLIFSGGNFTWYLSSLGTVQFTGPADQSVGGPTQCNFDGLDLDKAAGTVTLQGDIGANSSLQMRGGAPALDFNGHSLFTNSPANSFSIALSGSGLAYFTGFVAQTLDAGSNTSTVFPDFQLYNPHGLFLTGGRLRIGGNFSQYPGVDSPLSATAVDLDFSGASFQMNDSSISIPTISFLGSLAQTLDAGTVSSTGFTNFTVSKTASAVTLQNHGLNVFGNLLIVAGGLSTNGQRLNVYGNLSNTGSAGLGTGVVTLAGASQSISGTSSFATLSKTSAAGDTLSFAAGKTQTVSTELDLYGATPGTPMLLRSTLSGTRFFINAAGIQGLQNLDVKDSYAVTPIDVRGKGCIDSGNNVNWIFVDSPTPTPSRTATPSDTPTSTPTITPSDTPSSTSTITPTDSPSSTPTLVLSDTPSSSTTATPSLTPSPSPSASPSVTTSTTPSVSATLTPSPIFSASPTATASPVPATPRPGFSSSGLGRSVFAPVPVKRGAPLCLYFDSAPLSADCTLYDVLGEKVAAASLEGSQLCLDSARLAAGIYFASIDIRTQSAEEHRLQKLAVIP
jgi:hypothetical protein